MKPSLVFAIFLDFCESSAFSPRFIISPLVNNNEHQTLASYHKGLASALELFSHTPPAAPVVFYFPASMHPPQRTRRRRRQNQPISFVHLLLTLRRHRTKVVSLTALSSILAIHWLGNFRLPVVYSVSKKTRTCKSQQGGVEIDVALNCLRKTDSTLQLEYPRDAESHFNEIRRLLFSWSQHEGHKMHSAAGYSGPWIENHWISTFETLYDESDSCLSDHFGPFVPIFIPWVDIWVNSGFRYPPSLVRALSSVLRPNVPYITVSQNDDGLTGKNEILMSSIPNVLVLSAGGYGHVPIPLFKQEESIKNNKLPNKRSFDVSYVGTLAHAPQSLREKMDSGLAKLSYLKYTYYKGADWRQIMADSRFSLAPRGYGRTSYHLVEILQSGLIPIHVYSDIPWVLYANVYQEIGFTSHFTNGTSELAASLKNMTTEEIMRREKRIVELRESHFSVKGVMDQIQRFMLDQENDLQCQKLPDSARDSRDSGMHLIQKSNNVAIATPALKSILSAANGIS